MPCFRGKVSRIVDSRLDVRYLLGVDEGQTLDTDGEKKCSSFYPVTLKRRWWMIWVLYTI